MAVQRVTGLLLALVASVNGVSLNMKEMCEEAAPRTSFEYKNLNGEPSLFTRMALPPDSAAVTYTSHTIEKFTFPTAMVGASVEQDIYVDSSDGFVLGVFVNGKNATVSMKDPQGHAVEMKGEKAMLPIGDSTSKHLDGVQFDLTGPAGVYKLTVGLAGNVDEVLAGREKQILRKPQASPVDGFVVYGTNSSLVMSAHVENSARHVKNGNVGILAKVVDSSLHPLSEAVNGRVVPALGTVKILEAEMDVEFPDGHHEETEMHDDGLHNDGEANDGEYGASTKASQSGTYILRAVFKGVDEAGNVFKREFEQGQKIVDNIAQLSGQAFAQVKDTGSSSRMIISLGLKESSFCAAKDVVLRPYAEVWGKDDSGNDVAVAFSTNLGLTKRFVVFPYVQMELDLKWAAAAKAKGPFTLKNVYLEEVDGSIPLDMTSSIQVHMFGASEDIDITAETSTAAGLRELDASVTKVSQSFNGEITTEMREGVRPQLHGTIDGKVVLVHGFCADKNPFEVHAEDWHDAVFYSAAREGNKLSGENNYNAENVLRFVNETGLGSFSYVGQSQGGMVGNHIKNYYHTGMDLVSGRVIQTLATPYQGNSALTSVGGILNGGDCEGPNDLTRSGAIDWLAGITPTTLSSLTYYYTNYKKTFLGGHCQLLMNAFLQKPNDGVTEDAFAHPTGDEATQCGTPIEGQCHTENMNYMPSFFDHERNSVMSYCAARGASPVTSASCQC